MDSMKIIVVISTALTLCLAIIFSGLSNVGRIGKIITDKNLFPNDFHNKDEQVLVEPMNKIYAIWVFIYIYQVAWMCYSLSLIFRRNAPELLNKKMHGSFAFALICNIVWMFIWCREMYALGFIFYILQAIFLNVSLYFAFSECQQYCQSFPQAGRSPSTFELWPFRLLVVNGLAFFTGWVSISGLVNLAVVLQTDLDVKEIPASKVSLSLVLIFLVVWAILQNYFCEEYTRFMFAEYLPIIIALGGMIAKKWHHLHEDVRSFALALFIISLMLLIFRLGTVITREAKRGALQLGPQEPGENVKLI